MVQFLDSRRMDTLSALLAQVDGGDEADGKEMQGKKDV